MPDRPKSDPPPVPAGQGSQRANLVRLVIVVGLPLVSVFFRLPIWFTLLLMGALAVLLFLRPRLPQKSQPDPKQAWTLLMANFTRLQSACEALEKSPADAEARKRFTTLEERCLSLLNSYTDSDWGPDSAYAAKVRNEIGAMSASVSAEGRNPAPTPVSGAVIPPPESPAPEAKLDVPPPAEKPTPTPASVTTAAPPESPAPAAKPEVPPPAEKPSPTPTSEAAVLQLESSTPATKPEVESPAEKLDLTPASEAAAAPPESPAPTVKPEAPPPAEKPGSPAPAVRPEVPVPAEKQGLPSASKSTAEEPSSPAPAVKPEVPPLAEMPSPAPATEAAAAPPESPAPATKSEVPPPVEKLGPAPAGETAVLPSESPTPAARLDVPRAAGRRLIPYLWLPGGVEDAAAFYVSVFRNSRVVSINRYPESLHAGTWSVLTATISLDGQDLMLLNGGTAHNLPGSFQLLVRCADQAEVDYYWERLLAGGGEECTGGWLKDRFGVSWQVIPDALLELLNDPNPQRAARATEAMLKMKKIDTATLCEAVGQPEAVATSPPS